MKIKVGFRRKLYLKQARLSENCIGCNHQRWCETTEQFLQYSEDFNDVKCLRSAKSCKLQSYQTIDTRKTKTCEPIQASDVLPFHEQICCLKVGSDDAFSLDTFRGATIWAFLVLFLSSTCSAPISQNQSRFAYPFFFFSYSLSPPLLSSARCGARLAVSSYFISPICQCPLFSWRQQKRYPWICSFPFVFYFSFFHSVLLFPEVSFIPWKFSQNFLCNPTTMSFN